MRQQEIIDRLRDVAKEMDAAACRQDPREMEGTLRRQADFLRTTAERISKNEIPSAEDMKAANGLLSRVVDYLVREVPPNIVNTVYREHVMSIVARADLLSLDYCHACPVRHSDPVSKCENKKIATHPAWAT